MNQNIIRKIQLGLSLALATSVALVAASASADVDDETTLSETSEALSARVPLLPRDAAGNSTICSISGQTRTGRQYAYLRFEGGNFVSRVSLGGDAPTSMEHCTSMASRLGYIPTN